MRPLHMVSLLALPLLAGSSPASAPAPAPGGAPAPVGDLWEPVRFLVGEWIGEGSGEPGQGRGWTSFHFALDGQVIERVNHSEYPPKPRAAKGIMHDDRMTLFREDDALHAIYFDNEGHVIRYAVAREAGGVAFLSEPGPGPRFKLVYMPQPDGRVRCDFFIAPPGGAFARYAGGLLRRKP